MLIRCKYCRKDGVFEFDCTCSNEEARKEYDSLEEENQDYKKRELSTHAACQSLLDSGVSQDIIEKFWDSTKKADIYYLKWLSERSEDQSIIVSVLHLICPNTRQGQRQEDGTYKQKTSKECLEELIEKFGKGRREKDRELCPTISAEEVIESLKE